MLEFRFPDIGEGISEGVILEWFVQKGDEVKEGDNLFMVETDKVNAEIPAPRDGVILDRFGEVGDTINVGDVVVNIGARSGQQIAEQNGKGAVREEDAGVVGVLKTSSQVIEPSRELSIGNSKSKQRKVLATPVARHLAKDLNVDLATIVGSGPAGRIMKEDIEKAAAAKQAPAPEVRAVDPREERIALSTLGKTVARTMSLAKQEIPHAAVLDEFDVSELVQFRNEAKGLAAKEDLKLTYLPFIIKATALALREFPYFNASFAPDSEEIVLKKDYNIGIAVDTADGLIVPVIKNADRLGLLSLAKEVESLAAKARQRTLALEDIQGGTFSITNYGAVGALSGIPVIKHPEAAILGIGLISKKPVFNAEDKIEARYILPISLVFDHRFIDGGNAGRFMQRIKEYLQEPFLLLMS